MPPRPKEYAPDALRVVVADDLGFMRIALALTFIGSLLTSGCSLLPCTEHRDASGLLVVCDETPRDMPEALRSAGSFAWELADEHPDAFGLPWADPDADNMFGSKSEIEVQIVPQGPDQKTRDDEQSERQGHLSDDQAVLKAHARAATCENGFQGRAQLNVRRAKSWHHPEEQEREGRHCQRERKHSSIKVCRKR